ncbi:MAG: hypothetical protein GEV10_22470 [Streptosporangiales bacterium]|nr:hypothetical protein [Streptosporangiales bacterium]
MMIDDVTDTIRTTDPGASERRRWPWPYALGGLAIGVLTLVGVLWVGGGSPQPAPAGLPDAGPLVGWLLPIVRFLTDAAVVVAAGTALTATMLLPATTGAARTLTAPGVRLVRTAGVAAGVGVVAAAAQIVLTYADFLGVPIGAAVTQPGISSFVTDTVQGRALLAQVVLMAVIALASGSASTTRAGGLITVAAYTGMAVPALAGHSAAVADHTLAQSSLLVHVVAAAAWIGGLVGVTLVAGHPDVPLRTAFGRFSALALWCAVAVGLSGLANAWVRIGGFDGIDTRYGLLALGKALAFALLVTAGWLHRSRTAPRLDTTRRPFVRLAAAEVAVMCAAVGLAVGLSRTPTPVPDEPETMPTTAEAILGFPMPPAPTPWRLVSEAYLDGFWLTFVLLAGALYLTGLRVLARRGDRWPVGRTVAWFGGLAAVLVLTSGGVGKYAMVLFSLHMVQHMSFNMVVPILLVLGGPITLALRALPARSDGTGLRRLLLDFLKSRFARVVTHPLVAAAIFVTSLYVVYYTGLFDVLMRDHWGHLLMQAHFLLSGGLFFWVLVGIDPGSRRLPYPLRMVLLLVVMATHAFFSVALMSYGRIIGSEYYALLDRPWGADLLTDQRLGGGIGWAFGEIPVLLVLGALFVQWVAADRRRAAAYDRALDRADAEAERARRRS